MGSGDKEIYGSSINFTGSQPYAPTYHVVAGMLEKDKQNPNIYDPKKGYFHNPTAIPLRDAIENNQIIFKGEQMTGTMIYVLTEDDEIIIGERYNPNRNEARCPHPTLIGGKNPTVKCVGIMKFDKGKILSANISSGHYKPNAESLAKMYDVFRKICETNPDVFHEDFKWRH